MKKKILAIVTMISFFFLLATMGASDCGQLETKEVVIRSVIGLIIFGGGAIGLSL